MVAVEKVHVVTYSAKDDLRVSIFDPAEEFFDIQAIAVTGDDWETHRKEVRGSGLAVGPRVEQKGQMDEDMLLVG